MFGTIYRSINIETGMEYVGQTVQTLRERWVEHLSHARQKYSEDFCRKISASLSTRVRRKESYNTPKCIEKRKNYRHDGEARAAISAGLKGKPWSAARRAAQKV